jgi:hypothetical protein
MLDGANAIASMAMPSARSMLLEGMRRWFSLINHSRMYN